MIKPIICDEMFAINDGLIPEFHDGVIYVDNFYKNYEDIYEMLNSSWVPNWKMCQKSKNFVDYYDCRYTIQNTNFGESFEIKIWSLIQLISYYFKDDRQINIGCSNYNFNFFKNIKTNVNNSLQHHPHVDVFYNALVYLDKQCSGGTAIYPEIDNLENDEASCLLFDVSNISKEVIQAKPNRLVIFDGKKYHGGYIEDHNAYTGENWRINQVMFFNEVDDRTE